MRPTCYFVFTALWLLLTGCPALPGGHPAPSDIPGTTWSTFGIHALEQDSLMVEQTLAVFLPSLQQYPSVAELIIPLGKHFLTTPYVASTLEKDGEEQLVINLREMDCTTFVEYVLAMALTLKGEQPGFALFARNLACIRYRDGIIRGYPSRLHYFSEWLQNNESRGLIEIVSNQISKIEYPNQVSFMTQHTHLYKQLANPANVESMRMIEQQISAVEMHYIPKEQIEAMEHLIKDGDIIAFTTNIEGLDVSHTGFAIHLRGRLHLLHASARTHQVEITAVPLSEYLKPMRRVTGILAGRALTPIH